MQEDLQRRVESMAQHLRSRLVAAESRRGRFGSLPLQNIVAIVFAVIVIAGVVITGTWRFSHSSAASPIPSQYSKGLDFPLYFPTRLPSGYHVDETSFQRQDGVLIFNIVTPGGKNLAVSEEATPTNAPARDTSNTPANIAGERTFDVAAGHAHIGLWGDKYVADILADQTWIIINGTGFTADQLTPVAQSFRKLP